MAISAADETRLKALLKEAVAEVLEQHREWFSALMIALLEERAFVQAIKEGEQSEIVSRKEVFAHLERISQCIEDLVRPHVMITELEAGYAAMAADEAREAEALVWSEGTLGERVYEPR